ncbi:MAG: hypothetical protein DRH04_09585 [Deltaproteobacteria bacterium]|nr:MAG: hypothetical protein DRH04_09585 [Deltaproteobacteria bacterium]
MMMIPCLSLTVQERPPQNTIKILIQNFKISAQVLVFSILLKFNAMAGLTPATQIRVSGCSGMALAHSRRPSMAGSEASAANHIV